MVALLLLLLHSLGVLAASIGISRSGTGLEVDVVFFGGLSLMVAAVGLSLVLPSTKGRGLLALYLILATLTLRGLEVAVRHPLLFGIDAWQHYGYASLDLQRQMVIVRYEGGPGNQVWLDTLVLLTGLPLLGVMQYAPVLLVGLTGLLLLPIARALGGSPRLGLWALLLLSVSDGSLFVIYPQTVGLLLLALLVLALVQVVPARSPLERWPWTSLGLLAFTALGQTHLLSFALGVLAVLFFTLGGLLHPKRQPILLGGITLLTFVPFLRRRTETFAQGEFPFLPVSLVGRVVLGLGITAALVVLWLASEYLRPRLLQVLQRLARPIPASTSAAAASLALSIAFLGIGMAGGISYLYPGKSSASFLIDNLFKVVLGALALGGGIWLFQRPDRTPARILLLWLLPIVAVFVLGVFVSYRFDAFRYVLLALLPLVLLAGSFVVRQWTPRQAAVFTLGVLSILPMTYSPLFHTQVGPGRTYELVSPESYDAANWLAGHALRPSATGSDIRLSSLIYGTGRLRGTYSYVPQLFTDSQVVPGTELYKLMRQNRSGFDGVGVTYVFYDRDMLTYGASLSYYTAGRNFTTPLTSRELDKFHTQPIFNEVYDSGDAWVYYVNQRALP